ncbi:NRDE family protein [Marinobacterium weihaiense]|uniref:NRDE family protein n=1 Tax=Marinobacterium weihaiense TaxID=2851016 RepID=A0ABS6MCG7_9GAMM|nr:NRDE family protein [Marinobacterium weihaiense]MBV0933997.1 NRDE family protein [Marinobacterium weihaiense]
MCLTAFALDAHPDWPLILVANRDEFHARPAAPLGIWPDQPILGGRDLQAGGSWMGLGDNQRFALITNHRDLRRPVPEQARSRGHLVTDFIHSELSATAFCQRLDPAAYAGFNLLLREAEGWYHYSNVSDHCRRLTPGIHGLSNALLDTPWPKTLKARAQLQQALAQGQLQPEQLLHLLHDPRPAADTQLPDTGLPRQRERLLSSCFIVSEAYGTRASSLLLQHRSGTLVFMEESYDAQGRAIGRRSYRQQRPLLVQAESPV